MSTLEQTRYVPRHEAAGGIRRRFRKALDPKLFDYPRKGVLNHRVKWYLDGAEAIRRPTFGVYAMAMFAEYLFHQARFGKSGQRHAFREAAAFFAETRRALQNTLSSFSINDRLDSCEIGLLRRTVTKLVEDGRRTYEEVVHGASERECPACKGRKLSRYDAELLDAILCEQSRNGTIPRTSELYREAPLTPQSAL